MIRWNRHHALALCLSMISAQTRSAFVARENRFPLFRIMLQVKGSRSTVCRARGSRPRLHSRHACRRRAACEAVGRTPSTAAPHLRSAISARQPRGKVGVRVSSGSYKQQTRRGCPGGFGVAGRDIIRPSSKACRPLKHYFEVNRYSNCWVQAT